MTKNWWSIVLALALAGVMTFAEFSFAQSGTGAARGPGSQCPYGWGQGQGPAQNCPNYQGTGNPGPGQGNQGAGPRGAGRGYRGGRGQQQEPPATPPADNK